MSYLYFFSFAVAKACILWYNAIHKERMMGDKMKTVFYLVRHGQSMGNLQERMLGHTDEDLSELGYRQAAITFEYMKDWHIDAIYSSPFSWPKLSFTNFSPSMSHMIKLMGR